MVKERKFGAKTGVGHWIGHMDDELGVGCVVCIKHRDFGETNRNANYLSAMTVSTMFQARLPLAPGEMNDHRLNGIL